jgi:hypothetical protein
MSSTVTTTTVTMMTTAITLEGLMASLTLTAILRLGCLLLSKEVVNGGAGARIRRLAKGLDIAIVPLLLAFVTTVFLQAINYFNGY